MAPCALRRGGAVRALPRVELLPAVSFATGQQSISALPSSVPATIPTPSTPGHAGPGTVRAAVRSGRESAVPHSTHADKMPDVFLHFDQVLPVDPARHGVTVPLWDNGGELVHAMNHGPRTRTGASIQAAMDYARDQALQTGIARTVYVSEGDWPCPVGLLIPSMVSLCISERARLVATQVLPAGQFGLVQNEAGATGVRVFGGGTIDMDDLGASGTNVKGLVFYRCSRFIAENLTVLNSRSYGVWATDDNPGDGYMQPRQGVLRGLRVENCEEGIEILGVSDVKVTECEVGMVAGRSVNGFLNYTAGLGDLSEDVVMEFCRARGEGIGFAVVSGARRTELVSCVADVTGADSPAVLVGENAGDNVVIRGGRFRSEANHGIRVGAARGVTITGGARVDGCGAGIYGGSGAQDMHVGDGVWALSRCDTGDPNHAVFIEGPRGRIQGATGLLEGNTSASTSARAFRVGDDGTISGCHAHGGVAFGSRCIVHDNQVFNAPLEAFGTGSSVHHNNLQGEFAAVSVDGALNVVEDNLVNGVRVGRRAFVGTHGSPARFRDSWVWADARASLRIKRGGNPPSHDTDGRRLAERLVRDWTTSQLVVSTFATGPGLTLQIPANRMYAVPIEVEEDTRFSELQIAVSVAGPPGTVLRMGVMSTSPDGSQPLAVIYTPPAPGNTVAADVTGVRSHLGLTDLTIARGIAWLAIQAEGGAVTVHATQGMSDMMPQFANGGPMHAYYKDAQTPGALAWTGTINYSTVAPRVTMRVL
jgi:hypothetical protein